MWSRAYGLGSPTTYPNTRAIKELQKKLDILDEAKPIEAAKAEFLEFSKMMVKTLG